MGSEGPQDLVRQLTEMILVQFICLQPVEWTKCLWVLTERQKNCGKQAESFHVEEEKG